MREVTKEEALSYEKTALLAHIKKRQLNIDVFEKAIDDEREEIMREQQMVAIIEAHEQAGS